MSKIITGVIVGFGNRGDVYAEYSLQCPNEFKVVGVVDPNPFKLQLAKEKYQLKDDQLFDSLKTFIDKKIEVDIVINTTMDELHYETSKMILNAKYDLLMEKPIVPKKEQLLELADLANKNKCKVFICHVLRYTPFYRTIKQIINDGTIGKIVTMELNEHVCLQHYSCSYLRGKWNSEAKCGSGLILAKSCHDLDIMCWLNNSTVPSNVCSFGNRKLFVKENAPEGASEYCYQCKYKETCALSSVILYEKHNTMPFLVYDRLNLPLDSITNEQKKEFLHQDIYGKCGYLIESDLVDRQSTIVNFENGSTASFTLVGCAVRPNRYIHIIGSKGEIEGKLHDNIIKVTTYKNYDVWQWNVETIDLSQRVVDKVKYGGHSGGDFLIMHDLCAYLNGDTSSISMTSINDSINGHLCVYAAEESRKEHKIVKI